MQHKLHKNFTNFPLDFSGQIMYPYADPKGKEGDMEMNHNIGILLPDLDDLIYGRENYVSER